MKIMRAQPRPLHSRLRIMSSAFHHVQVAQLVRRRYSQKVDSVGSTPTLDTMLPS